MTMRAPHRVNPQTVKYAPVKKRLTRLTEEQLTEAKALLEKGLSYGEAARKLRVNASTLRNRFPGYNKPPEAW